MSKPLVEIKNLNYAYTRNRKRVDVIRNLTLDIMSGETLGLVGESGCGKTTLANLLMHCLNPSSGTITFQGRDLSKISSKELNRTRQDIQMVFQDPYSSVNPRMTVEEIIREPLIIYKIGTSVSQNSRIDELLSLVGLSSDFKRRYPHELSGGQRQRIVIARALAPGPKFLICDEPIAALDVSIQAQIVNLLKSLQKQLGLTYLFISHDLSVIKYVSDRIAVMYYGQIVELATSKDLYQTPLHPYTQGLLSSIPIPDPKIEGKRKPILLHGETPSFLSHIEGCPFASRCPEVHDICRHELPLLHDHNSCHHVACHARKAIPADPTNVESPLEANA